MRWNEIFDQEMLDEIEIVPSIGRNPNLDTLVRGSTEIEDGIFARTERDQTIWHIGAPPICYAITEKRGSYVWLLELWTAPASRGQGLAGKLLTFLIRRHGNLFLDQQLSADAARMVERLVGSGKVRASIADMTKGEKITYNPDSNADRVRPLYDEPITGIPRRPLPKDEALRYVWVLEHGLPRRGMLQPVTTILKEDAETWVSIESLPPEQKKVALAAFAKLADDQRGVPEDLGGAGRGNPDIFFANGAFTWLTEHVGDLTHRMAARGHEQINYGYDYVGQKVDRALRSLKHRYGIDREVTEQIKRNHEYRTEQGETNLPFEEWNKRVRAAGWRYANAHQRLVVYNRAQWLARESAVAIGEMNWSRATLYLEGLLQELETPERWTAFASQVHIGANGHPLSFRSP